jgi:hydroxyacylglutathione hydrolase
MIDVIAIDTPTLGDRGYLATDGEVALVVDAQRDFDRITALASDRGVTITHVLETHIHNDYVTGGYALARELGAQYLVNAADPVTFSRTAVHDGDVFEAGGMRVRAIGTPGHTFTHLSYALGDANADPADVAAVFTGGSLLNGSTGRTDLLGPDNAAELSRAQYDSVRRLARELPGTATVCPTHGFGSFCAAISGPSTPGAGPSSTIEAERRANPALTRSRAKFVAELLAGLDAYPAYYAHMASANLTGRAEPDLAPPRRADPAQLRARIDAGEWVVDLRSRTAFAAGHVRGTLNFEAEDSLATYLGWLIPWQTPLTLLASSPEEITAAQRELCRIGIDKIAAAASGAASDWAAAGERLWSYRVAAFADLTDHAGNGGFVTLDVRRRSEWTAGHLPGAVHIPLHELADRMDELPDGEIWVHCQGGYRAAVAASMLAATGRSVVLIDDNLDAVPGGPA